MSEILDLISEKLMHGIFVCLMVVAAALAVTAIWRLTLYFLTQNRVAAAKQIYNAIQLGEPAEKAAALFRDYRGDKDQYAEEALFADGKREVMLCLQFGFGNGEMGEMRLTYIDGLLVQKQQNGIW